MASDVRRGDKVRWQSATGWRSGEVAARYEGNALTVVDWMRHEVVRVYGPVELVVKRDDEGNPA